MYPGGYDAASAGHVSACLELHEHGASRDISGEAAQRGVSGAPFHDVFARWELALCDADARCPAPALAATRRDAPPAAVRRGRLARARRLASWRDLDARPSLAHDDVAVFRATVQVVRAWCTPPRAAASVATLPPRAAAGAATPPAPPPPCALAMTRSETVLEPPPRRRARNGRDVADEGVSSSSEGTVDESEGSFVDDGDLSDDQDVDDDVAEAEREAAEAPPPPGAEARKAAAARRAAAAEALRRVARAAGRRRAAVEALRVALYARHALFFCAAFEVSDESLF